jgi:hypothetical protein
VGGDADWALSALADGLRRMKEDCEKKGQQMTWLVFTRRRLEPLYTGKDVESLEETAQAVRAEFGKLISRDEVSNRQKTGEKKLERMVRDVLSEYCPDADEIDDELERLKLILTQAFRQDGRPKAH